MVNKRAQEEIVGFAIIVIIVSVILIFFLVFSLSNKSSGGESEEVASFLQATLQYTSSCQRGSQLLPVQDLILACRDQYSCVAGDGGQGEKACDVLNQTLKDMTEESWPIGPERPVKGYKFEIYTKNEGILDFSVGNKTGTYKGSQQVVPGTGETVSIAFTAYY